MAVDADGAAGAAQPVMDSQSLGTLVLPDLRRLLKGNDAIRAVILATAEGFNVCALGVDAVQVSKMASLVSSMNAMADAAVATASLDEKQRVTLLTIEGEAKTILLVTRVNAKKTPLLLMVLAQGAVLGVIHVLARNTAGQIARRL